MTAISDLRKTALYNAHVGLGARMVPFGGFEMPVQYAGVLKEHDAVRHRAGLFDLSHMGQFALAGPGVGAWADTLTVNHVATMKPGQARYNIFCNERGGAHDDVIFYRRSEHEWLLVVNAANADKMWKVVNAVASPDVGLTNYHGMRALIAIQGPRSVDIMRDLIAPSADSDWVAAMKYYSCASAIVGGIPVLLARTGYTGEDGYELFVEGPRAAELWDVLLAQGAPHGLEPCGLGARDVLRLEAGMPLYGNEMDEVITPIQAGLGWAVKTAKPEFVGKAALEAQLASESYPRIVGLVMQGRAPARAGYAIVYDGRVVGAVKSGSPAPSLENKNIATALVEASAAALGTQLDVEIRGTLAAATVVKLPFYQRPKT